MEATHTQITLIEERERERWRGREIEKKWRLEIESDRE